MLFAPGHARRQSERNEEAYSFSPNAYNNDEFSTISCTEAPLLFGVNLCRFFHLGKRRTVWLFSRGSIGPVFGKSCDERRLSLVLSQFRV